MRHVSGQDNTVADWLSRPETLGAAHTLDPPMDPQMGAVETPPDGGFSTVDHIALAASQAECPDVSLCSQNNKVQLLQFIPELNYCATCCRSDHSPYYQTIFASSYSMLSTIYGTQGQNQPSRRSRKAIFGQL